MKIKNRGSGSNGVSSTNKRSCAKKELLATKISEGSISGGR